MEEERGGCDWELELFRVNSLLDVLRLAASANSVSVLVSFQSKKLGGRIIGTFANNYGAMKPDIFTYVLFEGSEDGSFVIYKADETGESFRFSNTLAETGQMTFPIVNLYEEPEWFSERVE